MGSGRANDAGPFLTFDVSTRKRTSDAAEMTKNTFGANDIQIGETNNNAAALS